MKGACPIAPRRLSLALVLACVGLPAGAQQRAPSPPPPPPRVIVVPPLRSPYEATSRQQEVRDALRKGQLEEQLRQGTAEAIRRPSANDPTHLDMLDRADAAQRDRYRARQQHLLDSYRNAVQPPFEGNPAPARSG